MSVAEQTPRGGLTIVRKRAWVPAELEAKLATYHPRSGLGMLVKDVIRRYRLPVEAAAELIEALTRCTIVESALALVKIDGLTGLRTDYGIVSRRVVTNNGVGFIVDACQNLTEVENLKFHGIGTGVAAEAAADSALGTELTTQYNPDNTRATGTTTESAQNIYQTVGTNTLDSGTPAVTEHGVFSAATAGTLFDRSVFSAINLNGANGDALQSTYSLTLTAGS